MSYSSTISNIHHKRSIDRRTPLFTTELTLGVLFLFGEQMRWPTVLERYLEKHHYFGLCPLKIS
ncbi:MAG: hypothetical protein CM15mP83_6200 [Flavobacteriaceae bacterium]|nr:MAG: hypothetical protein CM15mP83_6200 [Flavobacteriaceae bacterium]